MSYNGISSKIESLFFGLGELVAFFMTSQKTAFLLILRDAPGVKSFLRILSENEIRVSVKIVHSYVQPYAYDTNYRPLKPGVKVEGSNGPPPGSVGYATKRNDNVGYVTALHVVTPNVFNPLAANQQHQPTSQPEHLVGDLDHWVAIRPKPSVNDVDAAFVKLHKGISISNETIHDSTQLVDSTPATNGRGWEFSGYKSIHGAASVIGTQGIARVDYAGQLAQFKDLIVTRPVASPGDSGGVLYRKVDDKTAFVAGILLGGESSFNYWTKVQNIERSMGTGPMPI